MNKEEIFQSGKWIRWLGALSAGVMLVIIVFNMDDYTRSKDIPLYLLFVILPAFATIFLSSFGRFWGGFGISLWLLFLGIMFLIDGSSSPFTILWILSAITVCTTPFFNQMYDEKRKEQLNEDVGEGEQQKVSVLKGE
ncbi:MAG: hypothetical protein JRJ86_14675 [Deltaproteobacteria bacterium]|nr:hypothetical protein [Deltaproteobacteria bacterium]MBW1795511.1 hypothetical protein [Deltaproteobacteria bacterium]MBW2033947.1 hypothetical protein [Deltaproteobacteria bacterium]